eukprot:7519555-Pyramimonas_sp.AAC.2
MTRNKIEAPSLTCSRAFATLTCLRSLSGPAAAGAHLQVGGAGRVCEGDALHPAALPLRGLPLHAQGGPPQPGQRAAKHRCLARVQGAGRGARHLAGNAHRPNPNPNPK